MRRFSIVTLVVLAMVLTALPASAAKPDKPGKPPPAEPTQYVMTMEFIPGAEGLSTMADPACGLANSIVMDWDGRSLGAAFEPAGLPMIDVNLGPELEWYRDYPYIPSPADVPTGFEPPTEPSRYYGNGITGCHGAGINVYVDFFAPGDHKYELNTGLFQLTPDDGAVNLLWHSDYYTPYLKINKKQWRPATIEDFTYSGTFTWTTPSGDPVIWDPATGASGIVQGDLRASHFSPGSYDLFPGAPRPVEFILTVTPQG